MQDAFGVERGEISKALKDREKRVSKGLPKALRAGKNVMGIKNLANVEDDAHPYLVARAASHNLGRKAAFNLTRKNGKGKLPFTRAERVDNGLDEISEGKRYKASLNSLGSKKG